MAIIQILLDLVVLYQTNNITTYVQSFADVVWIGRLAYVAQRKLRKASPLQIQL